MPLLVAAAENAALTAITGLAAYASLHSAYSATGANELTGGSPAYARKAYTWATASGGTQSMSGTLTFDVPAAATVAWVGGWSASSAGTFYEMSPLGGFSPHPFTATTADVITAPGHGLSNGQQVVFLASAGTLPTGLTEGTIYYVISVSGDTFSVSTTSGGSAVDLTAAGSGHVQRIVPEVFAAQGTYQLTAATLDIAS